MPHDDELEAALRDERAAADAARKWLSEATSWRPASIRDVLRGRRTPPPTLFQRTDGVSLLYAGKAHSFVGESESLKTWAAMHACAQIMASGRGVLYIDFEDTAETFVERMRVLGVPDVLLLKHLCYIRPDEPLAAWAQQKDLVEAGMASDPALVVLDGVTEAMAMHGWDVNQATDIAKYHHKLLRKLTRTGAATLEIDHAGKDELRGAVGSQHKRAGIDGVVYTFKPVEYAGVGRHGYARVSVVKDRHGHVRAHTVGSVIGEFHLNTSDDGEGDGTAWLEPSAHDGTATGQHAADRIERLEELARIVEGLSEPMSTRYIAGLWDKHAVVTQRALTKLMEGGYVTSEAGPRGATMWTSVRLFPGVATTTTAT
jgi:hypothetical protein